MSCQQRRFFETWQLEVASLRFKKGYPPTENHHISKGDTSSNGCFFQCHVSFGGVYLKLKVDGLPIPKGRLVEGRYVETVPCTFQLLYLYKLSKTMGHKELSGVCSCLSKWMIILHTEIGLTIQTGVGDFCEANHQVLLHILPEKPTYPLKIHG